MVHPEMSRKTTLTTIFALAAPCALFAVSIPACVDGSGEEHGDEHGHEHGETEVISQVELTFRPMGGGAPVTAVFDDPDGEGGMSGTSDTITLTAGETYDLSIRFLNALEDPAENITEEIEEEAEEHQVFVYGDGVMGPASASAAALVMHDYLDVESDYGDNAEGDDLPVGLLNQIVADTAGTSELKVMLRHLPEQNGTAQKVADLAQDLADDASLPGDVDADVSFELVVE